MSVETAHQQVPPLRERILRLAAINARDDDYFEQVADVVSGDPGLTGLAFRVANSPAYGATTRSTRLPECLARIGAKRYVGLAIGSGTAIAFGPNSDGDFALWRHAVLVAAGNRYIAFFASDMGLDPDFAFTLGVIHNVGAMVLAQQDPKAYAAVLDQAKFWDGSHIELEREALGTDHVEFGTRVAAEWRLPAEFQEVVRHHHAEPLPEPLAKQPHLLVTKASLAMSELLLGDDQTDGWRQVAAAIESCGVPDCDEQWVLEAAAQINDTAQPDLQVLVDSIQR
ncbi:MAG: HDOD domain-containing protein [Planctomycetota bacterium]